jgi:hypothetical protein
MKCNYLLLARARLLFIYLMNVVTRMKCNNLFLPRPILMIIYLEDE